MAAKKRRPRKVEVMRKTASGRNRFPVTAAKSTHPLAQALREQGVSQRKLARMAGVQQGDISRVLSGYHPRFAAGTAVKLYPIVKSWAVTMEHLIMPHGA